MGVLKQLDFKVTDAAQLLTIVDAKGKSRLGKSITETCTEILQSGKVGVTCGLPCVPCITLFSSVICAMPCVLTPRPFPQSSKLINIASVPENVARVALNKIWGVGPVTAAQMIRAGLRTIQDVRKAVQEESYPFSFQQKIGIRHYEDFQVRVVYPECAVGGRQSA